MPTISNHHFQHLVSLNITTTCPPPLYPPPIPHTVLYCKNSLLVGQQGTELIGWTPIKTYRTYRTLIQCLYSLLCFLYFYPEHEQSYSFPPFFPPIWIYEYQYIRKKLVSRSHRYFVKRDQTLTFVAYVKKSVSFIILHKLLELI